MCIVMVSLFGQQDATIATNLTKALQQSNGDEISVYFAPYVMLHVQDIQKVLGAQQAKMQIVKFFKQHPCSILTLTKSGIENNQQFFIWNYASGKENWRVYVLLATEKGQELIHQIDIENTP